MVKLDAIPDDSTGTALKQYASQGSDLDRPMLIDFFAAVPSQEAGVKLSKALEGTELTTSIEYDKEAGEWTCYCSVRMIPRYEDVVKMEELIEAKAKLFGGNADGFGSYGNADLT